MIYNYQLSEEAEMDVMEAYSWYEKQKQGLGEEFLEALDHAKKVISSNPLTYKVYYKNKVRAFVLSRFPFLVLYLVDDIDINVISVFNTNQHPKKWKKRL
ncbi:type II toxin-antitoxin system RelE/ParE family toxin [Litoribacter ruber]|uniref:Type II toxin-antitoxin system RelE/ParE family toxin n=1 Tax=Litoribacter ruber TaxID=702568 RepID=A0AAP2G2W1_9BACT|nr:MULTISPECIES: type II toxin-antitoxin system RelE/ParE family toxin [Litoribacter]MBS9522755.1 type II toxin-antitoxin system RelE/ParE family toxin [Litoribacter alkaliphilus]MBT0811253.1 type II toxin-antitoxin system RelE/ParE family toxin [Litoribacter ruber]